MSDETPRGNLGSAFGGIFNELAPIMESIGQEELKAHLMGVVAAQVDDLEPGETIKITRNTVENQVAVGPYTITRTYLDRKQPDRPA